MDKAASNIVDAESSCPGKEMLTLSVFAGATGEKTTRCELMMATTDEGGMTDEISMIA